MQRFAFDFSSPLAAPLRLFGIGPTSAYVEVDDHYLDARFGPFRVRTPLGNIRGVQVGGPYSPVFATGLRVSLRDRGLTFGTTPARGVCLTFRRPVTSPIPGFLLGHPGLTLTVEDPDGLAEALLHAVPDGIDRDEVDDVLVRTVEAAEEAERLRERRRHDSARRAAQTRRENREAEAREAQARQERRTQAQVSRPATAKRSASGSTTTATKSAPAKKAAAAQKGSTAPRATRRRRTADAS